MFFFMYDLNALEVKQFSRLSLVSKIPYSSTESKIFMYKHAPVPYVPASPCFVSIFFLRKKD